MARITIQPYAKIILSAQDRCDLRKLVIEIFEFAEYVQSKEETIRCAQAGAAEFLESRALEITHNI